MADFRQLFTAITALNHRLGVFNDRLEAIEKVLSIRLPDAGPPPPQPPPAKAVLASIEAVEPYRPGHGGTWRTAS